jgi:hypothetical protein
MEEEHLQKTEADYQARLAKAVEACCFHWRFCWEEPGPLEEAAWHEPV